MMVYMTRYVVTFPNQETIELPERACTAIAEAKAKYATPMWELRAERVLKLGAHQWITPADVATAQALIGQHRAGFVATAWKLFNRSWEEAAHADYSDVAHYPNHPRHLGSGVIPLVDEDRAAQQIGWVRITQVTAMDHNFAVFIQFTLLDLFAPRPLPAEYA